MRNNPINYNDPSGHVICDDEGVCLTPPPNTGIIQKDGGSGNGVEGGTDGICSSSICNPNGGGGTSTPNYGSGYSGPLPDDIVNVLVSQGASQDLLDDVVIDIETPAAKNRCGANKLAVAFGNNIYICQVISPKGKVVFDQTKPTPVLVHELIHVRQFRNNYIDTLVEAQVNYIRKVLDPTFNPYQESGNMEYDAAQCQNAFEVNPNLSLDSGVCTLK